MSKLLKLKQWLTLEDAARHLSTMFEEEVSVADILRLALDSSLTLSVNFVNGARARCGLMVSADQAKYFEVPSDFQAAMGAKSPKNYQGGFRKIPHGVPLNSGDVIELSDTIDSLQGVYDLPMIGNERLDVEDIYQKLTGGAPVTLLGLDGTFVLAGDGSYCQLQEGIDENEHVAGSMAQLRQLEVHIVSKSLDVKTADDLRAKHKADREEFKKKVLERPAKDNSFPASGLPADSVLVVRCDALLDLQQAMTKQIRCNDELSKRERDTLLKLVIGMAIGGYGHSPTALKSNSPSEIESDLAKCGISLSDDTVRKWLKEAASTVLPKKAPNT